MFPVVKEIIFVEVWMTVAALGCSVSVCRVHRFKGFMEGVLFNPLNMTLAVVAMTRFIDEKIEVSGR